MRKDIKEMKALEANFLKRISPLIAEAISKIQANPSQYAEILKELDFDSSIKAQIVESALLGVVVGRFGDMNKVVWSDGLIVSSESIRDVSKMRRFLLDTTLGNSKTQLVKTLRSTNFNDIVAKEIKQQFKQAKGWQSIARGLRDSTLKSPGELPKHLKNLLDIGRKQNLTLLQKKELQKAINKSLNEISKLQNNGASTQYLKKSYERVIKAVEKGSEEAIKKTVESAIKNKTRYEAERIVRTESQANYGQARIDEALRDDLVSGLRFVLSSGHAPDQCDFYAEADLFGMGAGVWKKDQAPSLPIHPNGASALYPVSAELAPPKEFNSKNGIKFIKKSKNQKTLLGVSGMKSFKKNPEKWPELLKGGFKLEKQVIRLPN